MQHLPRNLCAVSSQELQSLEDQDTTNDDDINACLCNTGFSNVRQSKLTSPTALMTLSAADTPSSFAERKRERENDKPPDTAERSTHEMR